MSDTQVLQIVTDAIFLGGKIAAPLLLSALVIGVGVSLIQAVTQVQEMTLSFVPKLVGLAAVVLFAGHWMLQETVTWMQALWSSIPTLV